MDAQFSLDAILTIIDDRKPGTTGGSRRANSIERRMDMLDRYNESARRVIFYARLEAGRFGAPNIETEHLLLGLMQADWNLVRTCLTSEVSAESIRAEISSQTPQSKAIPQNVDLPISDECKHVLAFTTEAADAMGLVGIGTAHLLLGLLREEHSLAARILREHGVSVDRIHQEPGTVGPLLPKRPCQLRPCSRRPTDCPS